MMKDEHELHSSVWLQDKHSSEQEVHTPNFDEKILFGQLHESKAAVRFNIAKQRDRT